MANRESIEPDDDAIFVKNGTPVRFCFHKSVTQGRGQITRDVERHGGQIVLHERLANVLLVDEQENLEFFRRRYYSSTELYRLTLYIEPRGFVQACIRTGAYRHVGPIRQGMPGPVPGGERRARVPFTEEDRDHLAYYLATRFPMRHGRLGMSAYKDLERLGQTPDRSWTWARRHTAHSWREHYKINPGIMDVRIDYYLQQLKDIGHHFGHDPRTRDVRNLRQELEEGEEEDDEEEGQWQGVERQGRDRREQVRLAVAERRLEQAARDHPARHEQELVRFDEEEDGSIQEEEAIQATQRVKHHRVHPGAHNQHDSRERQAKRARVSEASSSKGRGSGVEAGRGERSSAREEDGGSEESQEVEGSDLFGDRTFEDESRSDLDDSQDIGSPMSFPPRTSPVSEQDGPPPSTQATLIASPRSPEKGHAPVPAHTPTKSVKAQAPISKPNVPPSSQQTLVMTQERVVVQRARVRGGSAQPGPSMDRQTRTQSGTGTTNAPYRNTRARSRSVEPQLPRQQENKGDRGKAKAKEDVLVSIEEDIDAAEEQREAYTDENAGPSVTGGLSMRETFEDEMTVEGLLEASVNEIDEADGGSEEGEHDEDDESSDGDEDGELMLEIPRFQEIEIRNEPSDSDDAETHESLVRGVVQEASTGGSDASEEDKDQDEGEEVSDDDDADRIERMANGSLHATPAPTLPLPRTTRSRAVTQTQTQTDVQISPRRTRSGNQARAAPTPTPVPRPGTKARAVVDRVQEEERMIPYAPPAGSRAAKAARGKGK